MIDFLSHHAGLIGLLFFFTFFILVLVSVFRPGMKEQAKKHANIPFGGHHE
ncbi:MAG: CcoQ/FixQ family Cbb3-type cytochrome c oxidase assembly chaperone [Pseudobdellovibrionaceae bacterium]